MKLLFATLLFATFMLAGVNEVDAQSRWYPRDCHGGGTVCTRALSISPTSRGQWIATVRGRVFVPYGTASRRSRDGRTHVCTVKSGGRLRPVCLFRPKGSRRLPMGGF